MSNDPQLVSLIPPEADAFGAALKDHLVGRRQSDLVLERDEGWHDKALPPEWFFAPQAEWADAERRVLGLVREGPVLDLGCGGGRHSLHFQSLGLDVTAVDVSPGAIEVCRERGVRDARLLDLRTPPRDKEWRTILLMCGNLGLGETWEGTRRVLTRLASAAAPGALLIGATVDPTYTQSPAHVSYQQAMLAAGRHRGEVRLRLRYGGKVSPWWNMICIPGSEMSSLVEGTGWTIIEHVEDGCDQYVALVRRGPRSGT